MTTPSPTTTAARAEARQVAPKLIELSETVVYGDVWERPQHLAFYAGWPAAMSAARITKQIFDEQKERKP